jgi:hypothetical protein
MPKVNGKWVIRDGMSPLGKYTLPRDENLAGKAAPPSDAMVVQQCAGLDANFAKALSAAIDDWKEYTLEGVVLGQYGFLYRDIARGESLNGNSVYWDKRIYFGWGIAAEVSKLPAYSGGQARRNAETNAAAASAPAYGLNYAVVPSAREGDVSAYDAGSDPLTSANAVEGEFDSCLNAYGLALYYSSKYSVGSGMFICPLHIGFDSDISEPSYDAGYYDEGSSGGVINTESQQASVASLAYYFSNQFESVSGQLQSLTLRGNRALANDKPLFDTIKSAVNSSLRSFSSGPAGEFVAWFPDYWGLYGAPTLMLSDMELLDLTIERDGDAFRSHVYCAGVDSAGRAIGFDRTQGVVSIESNVDALTSSAAANDDDVDEFFVSDKPSYILKALLGIKDDDPDAWKYSPKELYRRYGARPASVNAGQGLSYPLIESGMNSDVEYESNPQYILPFLYALYAFMENWSNQTSCNLTITYMPCLRPGMRIRLESIDVEMYVKSVTHTMNYSTGFTTSVSCCCPIGSLVPGMLNPDFDSLVEDYEKAMSEAREAGKDASSRGSSWEAAKARAAADRLSQSFFDQQSDADGGEELTRDWRLYSNTGGGQNYGTTQNLSQGSTTGGWDTGIPTYVPEGNER